MTREEFEGLIGAHHPAGSALLAAWDAQTSALAEARRAIFEAGDCCAAREAAESRAAEAHRRGWREGVEAAANAVEYEIGSFQGPSGPYKRVDSALRLVAAGIRALAPPGAPEGGEP